MRRRRPRESLQDFLRRDGQIQRLPEGASCPRLAHLPRGRVQLCRSVQQARSLQIAEWRHYRQARRGGLRQRQGGLIYTALPDPPEPTAPRPFTPKSFTRKREPSP